MDGVSDVCQRHHAKALSFYKELRNCQDAYIRDVINWALDALDDALRLYGSSQLLSSYNGGKDADVVMHLLRAAIAKHSQNNNTIYVPKLVYFSVSDEFPEVLEHIEYSERLFDLQLKRYSCGIIDGIKQHAEANKGSAPAFVLGTRHGDPNCGTQGIFAPSSNWSPVAFMRVNPIIGWSYGQVWHFLRLFKLPYCKLYDDGYTSLGQRHNTLRNPYLRQTSTDGEQEFYWPAYLLADWDQERAGRVSKSSRITSTLAGQDAESTEESLTPGERSSDYSECDMSIGLIVVKNCDPYNIYDINIQCTNRLFSEMGVKLKAVAMVENSLPELVEELQRMQQKFDKVIVCREVPGCMEDMHDTVERAVAAVFQREMVLSGAVDRDDNAGTGGFAGSDKDSESESGSSKPTSLPQGSLTHIVTLGTESSLAVVQCENVYILRSDAEHYNDNMRALAVQLLKKRTQSVTSKQLLLLRKSEDFTPTLDQLSREVDSVTHKVDMCGDLSLLTIQGVTESNVNRAISFLLKTLSTDCIIRIEK